MEPRSVAGAPANGHRARERRRLGTTRAFTLVELLAVVLILSIVMAVATPIYLSATANAQRSSCRANMQMIANAEYAYKIKSATHTYVAVSAGNSLTGAGLTDLQANPVCPNGGQYSVLLSGTTNDSRAVPSGGLAVQCSAPASAHGSFIPGQDTQ